ncbi:MAG: glutamate-cysteine ligase family protein [bacterium]
MMSRLSDAPGRVLALRDDIHAASFVPDARRPLVGAEVEFLAHDASDFPVPLLGGPHCLVELLRQYGARSGWNEHHGYGRVPRFEIPGRAIVSFEPGGQLEISTLPCDSASALIARLNDIVLPLRSALNEQGVRLESIGIDPHNDARAIPLQLPVDRYETMTRYFDAIGPFGVRMMRQTAAIQVSLDRGTRPAERWRLLNDLAPYVVAIFANSPHYCGGETGHRSYRAHCWRMLDATRTGVSRVDRDPAAEYTQFALAANDMTRGAGERRRFGDRSVSEHEPDAWRAHLTTLFPEVRPRGHFEVRSCDAIAPEWYAAPIVFLYGIAHDARASAEASILAADSRALLRAAGESGLRDASIARTARDLFQLAIAGARRLGAEHIGGADVERAEEFFATYTSRERSPADDRVLAPQAAPASSARVPST